MIFTFNRDCRMSIVILHLDFFKFLKSLATNFNFIPVTCILNTPNISHKSKFFHPKNNQNFSEHQKPLVSSKSAAKLFLMASLHAVLYLRFWIHAFWLRGGCGIKITNISWSFYARTNTTKGSRRARKREQQRKGESSPKSCNKDEKRTDKCIMHISIGRAVA